MSSPTRPSAPPVEPPGSSPESAAAPNEPAVPPTAASDDGLTVLKAVGVAKRFGHVEALRGVDLELRRGEVLALLGDNGAGKSTLTKCLCGVYQPSEGHIEIGGKPVELRGTHDAEDAGFTVVHQDLALAPHLSVLENMFLGHEILRGGPLGRLGVLDRKAMAAQTREALSGLSIRLPSLSIAVQELSGGQRQAVAVARARMWSTQGILMDEPTAALGTIQSDLVCELIRTTADSGMGVMVISHDIPRILAIADRVIVLRHGAIELEASTKGLQRSDVVAAMVGLHGDPEDDEPRHAGKGGGA